MANFDDLNPFLVRQDGNAYQNGSDTTNENGITYGGVPPNPSVAPAPPMMPQLIIDQKYVENILRSNIGKSGKFYFSYPDSAEWRDRMYRGVIEIVGGDHFVIHDPITNKRYLVQMMYFNWAEFDDDLKNRMPYL